MKRLLFLFIILISFFTYGQNGQIPIEDAINSFDIDSVQKTKVGYQYRFLSKEELDGRTIKMSVVKPGLSTHAPHKHIQDEFFFILEGKAKFYLNGEERIVGPLTSLYCPSWSMHGIANAGEEELKYLVLQKYPKTEE